MEEIIKITESNGKSVVSAKELYDFLGYDKSQWSRWYQTNINKNEFAVENEDYQTLDIMSNGNITKDFALTIDFAKEISMLARNEKGKQARLYFISCEKKLKDEQQNKFSIPQTLSEALYLAASQAKQIEEQNKQLEEQKPKVEFFNQVTDSTDAVDMKECAKILNMGIGRNRLFEFLRSRAILDRKNLPYQSFIDRGYFRTVETSYTKADGTNCINIKTVVYQKGMDYIRKIYIQCRKTNKSLTHG